MSDTYVCSLSFINVYFPNVFPVVRGSATGAYRRISHRWFTANGEILGIGADYRVKIFEKSSYLVANVTCECNVSRDTGAWEIARAVPSRLTQVGIPEDDGRDTGDSVWRHCRCIRGLRPALRGTASAAHARTVPCSGRAPVVQSASGVSLRQRTSWHNQNDSNVCTTTARRQVMRSWRLRGSRDRARGYASNASEVGCARENTEIRIR